MKSFLRFSLSFYIFFGFYNNLCLSQSEINIEESLKTIVNLRENKKDKEAIQTCIALLQQNNLNERSKANIYFELATIYLFQNNLKPADSLFQISRHIHYKNNDYVKWAATQIKLSYIMQLNKKSHDIIIDTLLNVLKFEQKIEQQDPNVLMNIYNNLAVAYYYDNKIDSLNFFYNKIYLLSLKHPLNNLTTLINLADYFSANYDISKAIHLISQCEKLLKKENYTNTETIKYAISISHIYLLAFKYSEGINLLSQYQNIIKNNDIEPNPKAEFYLLLGDLYSSQQNFTKATANYIKASQFISPSNKMLYAQSNLKLLITKAKTNPDRFNLENLENNYKKFITLLDPNHKAFVQYEISRLYFEINNFMDAKYYLIEAKTFYQKNQDKLRLQIAVLLEKKINEILINVNTKKLSLSAFSNMADSLVSAERDAIEALTLKNANDQKAMEMQAKELELSTEREKSLNSRIQLQNVMIISLLGAILLFVALYQYKKRLQKQKAMAKVREEELQSYNYFVSHDLLQPINNVKNLVHQLDSIPINQKDKINTQLLSAQNIVERLLHLFQIEKTDLYTTPFLVNEWINKIISEYQHTHPEVSWQCFIDQTSKYKLRADVFLLTQCLKNILDNAIKYGTSNESPTITIITALSKNHFILKIADNGSGITNGNEATLFEPFKQLSPNKKGNGFGVGLSIVKKIIEKHEGLISAQNVSSGGLELKIELPIY